MKILPLILISFLLLAFNGSQEDLLTQKKVRVTKIWDEAQHSAFTSLVRFQGAFYCSFREGSGHMPGTDGKIRVIKSQDGKKWESVALLEKDIYDLRDPMLSVTPDGKLMLSIGGSIYDVKERSKLLGQHPHVSFSNASGTSFSDPEKITIDPPGKRNWIWRVTWHKDAGYGMSYTDGGLNLMRTADGKRFEKVTRLEIDGFPNESTIRFDKNDVMYVLVRRESGDQKGVLATSHPPYTQWSYKKINMRLGGPNFVFSGDGKRLIIGSRLYEQDGHRTGIVVTDLDGDILKTIKLPSKGDTSYTGLVLHDGKLWVSYYSSHEAKTSIYLATIPVGELDV